MAAILWAFFFVLPGVTVGQTIVTGALTGVVTDPSGAVVSGATVTLTNLTTGEMETAATGSGGTYQFPLLKPGD